MEKQEKNPINPNTKALIVIIAIMVVITAVLMLFPTLLQDIGAVPEDGRLTLDQIDATNLHLFTCVQLQTGVPWHVVYGICHARYQIPYDYDQAVEVAQVILDAGAEQKGLLFSEDVQDLVSLYTINKGIASPAIRYALRLEFANAFLKAGLFPLSKRADVTFSNQPETYVDSYTIQMNTPQDVIASFNGQVNYITGEDDVVRLFLKGSAGVDMLYELHGQIAAQDGAHVKAGDVLGTSAGTLTLWMMQNANPIDPFPYLYYWQHRE